MRRTRWLAAVGLLGAGVAQGASHFDGESWWQSVQVLADDRFEGRETGSSGEAGAQAYIVQELKKLHVEPAGTDGFYQTLKLQTVQIDEGQSQLALVSDGQRRLLKLGEQAYFSTRIVPAPHVAAPLVFVGYGLDIPELGYNDLAGLDLKGKVAVVLGRTNSFRVECALPIAR